MQVNREDLVNIVERASTITERLSTKFLPKETKDSETLINAKLEKWCKTVAQGNKELFEKRLAWDDLNLGKVRPVMCSVRLAAPDLLPAWVDTLEKALEATTLIAQESEINNLKVYRYLEPQHPIPFEEVFLGFIEVAKQKLIAQTGLSYQLLSEYAHRCLERSLLQQLCNVYIQAIYWEFSIFRSFQNTPFFHLSKLSSESPSTQKYEKFVKDMLEGKLLSFFQDYSVLARIMATLTDFWVDATQEFIQRLASDWSGIEATFQADLKQVVAVKPSLSDSHNQGRSAIALTFDSGLNLIYKPKNLGIEKAYFQFLSWLNQQGSPLPFKLLKVINRSTYGWVEYVEHLPCSDKVELQRYYQRAGMLLCVVYALQGTDCTDDNLIACGEHPVLVDMETLMYPQVQFSEAGVHSLGGKISNSVLDTGFLPQWQLGPDGESYDVSALGQVCERETSVRVRKWHNINTDSMAVCYEEVKTESKANLPYLNAINLSSQDYVEKIVDGFRQMYQFLMEHRKAILATDGPVVALAHQQVRFLLRDTIAYSLILEKTLNPRFLRNGVDWSIQLDFLSRVVVSSNSKPDFWLLLKAEQQVLEQLDIPHFTARADSDTLTIYPNQTLENFFRDPGYRRVIFRLHQLCQEDLERQIGFIRGTLGSLLGGVHSHSSPSEKVQLNLDEVVSMTSDQMVQQAMAIAANLQKWAIRFPDGSANWITLGYSAQAQRCQFQAMGYDLYNGCTGVALFLAALEKVVGNTGFRDLTQRALLPLRQLLQDSQSNQELAKKIGIGGATGLGSVIYALVRIGQFLNEPELLQDSKQAASLLTPEIIFADQNLDIMAGTAGAILGLLALEEITADADIMELAIASGNHLLNNRVKSEFCGYRAWPTLDGKLLTGFSHGAAGIAYALLRLYKATNEDKFLKAATEAIAYEGSVFSPEVGNWPDFRLSQPSFITNWCHGAPGIGLARLGSLAILDTNEIRQDIEAALITTQQFGISEVDHLCCGNFGRIDFLLVAACQLARSGLLDEAQKQAALIVSKAEKAHSFRGIYGSSFFKGVAGIGYELLRLAQPNLIPSVLLWK